MEVISDTRRIRGAEMETVEVRLPQTTVLSISTGAGYVMCGILDVDTLDRLHPERHVMAARIEGVKTVDDLLRRPVVSCTAAAAGRGVTAGMSGEEALLCMLP